MPMRVMPAAAQKFEVESFTLANGLQIVVLPNHRVPAVTQIVWYGSAPPTTRAESPASPIFSNI